MLSCQILQRWLMAGSIPSPSAMSPLLAAPAEAAARRQGPRSLAVLAAQLHEDRTKQNGLQRVSTCKPLISRIYVVAWGGIEPPTRGFSIRCSTN
jgi:hypothetical protein